VEQELTLRCTQVEWLLDSFEVDVQGLLETGFQWHRTCVDKGCRPGKLLEQPYHSVQNSMPPNDSKPAS